MVMVVVVIDGRGGCSWCCRCFLGSKIYYFMSCLLVTNKTKFPRIRAINLQLVKHILYTIIDIIMKFFFITL